MGFITVQSGQSRARFDVEKLDINLWILPGLLGRSVYFCDIGIKFQVKADALPQGRVDLAPEELRLTVGVPFLVRGAVSDLVPKLTSDGRTTNLVFGNSGSAPSKSAASGELFSYDDGEDNVSLLTVDRERSRLRSEGDRNAPYSLYSFVPEADLAPGTMYYVRLRFELAEVGRVWLWNRIGGWRAFAIADLRVNDLRDPPALREPPTWTNAVSLKRVNYFVIVSSRLKEQRRSPEPRYVRPLESNSWETYLDRRITTSTRELFLIYYWRSLDPVTTDSPFRAFLELERRRPLSSLYSFIAAAVTIVTICLLTPYFAFGSTPLAAFLSNLGALIAGLGLVVIVTLVVRVVQLARATTGVIAGWLTRLERRRFRRG